MKNLIEILDFINFQLDVAKPVLLKLVVFGLFVLFSLIFGRYTHSIVRLLIRRFSPQKVTAIYENLIEPIDNLFKIVR